MSLWQDVDLGSLPDWLAAVGTIAAAWVAVILAKREGQRAERAEAERDALRREQAREQAAKVVAWMEPPLRNLTTVSTRGWRVVARNVSDEPVFAVEAEVVHADGYEHVILEEWDVLPPRGDVERFFRQDVKARSERPYVVLTFTDAAGRRWRRGERGRLEEA